MIGSLVEGVRIREIPTHIDERGSVVEIYDLRWQWHPAPLVSAHCFTVRPGFVKGWGLHKTHEDRYFILQGNMDLVLYDPRPRVFDLWPNMQNTDVGIKSPNGQYSEIRVARGA